MPKFSFSGEDLRLRGYHETPSWVSIGHGDIFVGMEMEVSHFRDRAAVIRTLQQEGMRESFMLATTDSSIGASGIEWVTQPMGSEYLEEAGFDIIGEALNIMVAHGGRGKTADVSCGCHHNFSCEDLRTRTDWLPAMDSVFKYYDTVFAKFSGPNRSQDYARIPDTGDMDRFCRTNGKYSFFNFRPSGVVEMRFPGMVMNPDEFRCQTRLCMGAVEQAIKAKTEEVDIGDLTFNEIFHPQDEDLAVLETMGVHSRILKGAA